MFGSLGTFGQPATGAAGATGTTPNLFGGMNFGAPAAAGTSLWGQPQQPQQQQQQPAVSVVVGVGVGRLIYMYCFL